MRRTLGRTTRYAERDRGRPPPRSGSSPELVRPCSARRCGPASCSCRWRVQVVAPSARPPCGTRRRPRARAIAPVGQVATRSRCSGRRPRRRAALTWRCGEREPVVAAHATDVELGHRTGRRPAMSPSASSEQSAPGGAAGASTHASSRAAVGRAVAGRPPRPRRGPSRSERLVAGERAGSRARSRQTGMPGPRADAAASKRPTGAEEVDARHGLEARARRGSSTRDARRASQSRQPVPTSAAVRPPSMLRGPGVQDRQPHRAAPSDSGPVVVLITVGVRSTQRRPRPGCARVPVDAERVQLPARHHAGLAARSRAARLARPCRRGVPDRAIVLRGSSTGHRVVCLRTRHGAFSGHTTRLGWRHEERAHGRAGAGGRGGADGAAARRVR